ncbi:MAG: prepilin peptidase [Marivibrio sp.]|uniref:A24 family peptidase n=1 Tax=Marivibrio sp. TaxID=2039719 RepID=UPI0032EDF1D9
MESFTWMSPRTAELIIGPALPLSLLAALLIAAAVSDLRRFLIPNAIALAVGALGLVFQLQTGGPIGAAALVAGVLLLVGFVAYAVRLIGAGDVKLFAALALWAGPGEIAPLLLQTALLGGALSILWVLSGPLRQGLMVAGFDVAVEPPRRIPYGLAIAGGGLLLIARLWPPL